MSKMYVTGPAFCWVGTGAAKAFEFLGFTESGFGITINSYYEDIPVDYGGAMPGDVQYLGQDARGAGIFTRYNESIMQKCIARIPTETPGLGSANIAGTLMIAEGASYPVLIYAPYSVKSAFSDQPQCWYFQAGYLAESADFNVSIRVKRPNCIFRFVPVFGAAPYNTWTLYSNTPPSPLPAVN